MPKYEIRFVFRSGCVVAIGCHGCPSWEVLENLLVIEEGGFDGGLRVRLVGEEGVLLVGQTLDGAVDGAYRPQVLLEAGIEAFLVLDGPAGSEAALGHVLPYNTPTFCTSSVSFIFTYSFIRILYQLSHHSIADNN